MFPLGEAVLEAPGPTATGTELADRVVGVDAERSSAVGDDLAVLRVVVRGDLRSGSVALGAAAPVRFEAMDRYTGAPLSPDSTSAASR